MFLYNIYKEQTRVNLFKTSLEVTKPCTIKKKTELEKGD